ncbi:hypothetical protein JCM33374_g2777 [Metschnikowia sp. JCM 33374]|nr:hypothetical protein JCM33374_g2777 [Metschnikowia sp. JCM 33374]
MSDEDDYLSEESYEFEFEEDDDDEEIEDQSSREDSPEDSLTEANNKFRRLITSADEKSDTEWVFKAYKQLAKIHYQQQNYDLVLEDIGRLMEMLPELNGNYAEESISKILTRYAASPNHTFVKNLYDVIVNHLQDFISSGSSGHRLWLKININRLNNLLEIEDLSSCHELIDLINRRLSKVSESTRNSYALEIIAAEILFTMKTSRSPIRLGELYRRSLDVTPAITHPQVMGVVRECGATVHFFKGNYDKARMEFYECFKNYDEAGSSSKKKVLKYLIICCLLVESEVNPFESQETQSYAQLAEYRNLIELVEAYEKLDLEAFLEVEGKMAESKDPLSNDPIFVVSQKLLLHNLKVKMLVNLAKAYRTVRFDFIIDKLCLSDDNHLEHLLIESTNSGTLSNLQINFQKRYIICSTERGKLLFPPTMDENEVKNNVRSLYRLSFEGPWQLSSAGHSLDLELEDAYDDAPQLNVLLEEEQVLRNREYGSNVYEMLFGNSALQTDASLEQEEWLKYMRSAIPKKKVCASTQKDQVILEQREESEGNVDNSRENEEAIENTNKGILGSSVNYASDNSKKQEHEDIKGKLDLLHEWAHSLSLEVRHK